MTDRELMQQALDTLEHLQTDVEWQYKSPTRAMLRKIEKDLRARLTQPESEPEPVAWMHPERNTYTGAPAMSIAPKEDWIPLYTASREWVGLTDEEIMKITGVTSSDSDWNVVIAHKWIRTIEAKLKEKNT